MNAPDYGRSFASWREACAAPWQAYTRHPFVEGLGDGSLPRAGFLNYLRQDYVFLMHFSRAWSLAVVKADTLAEMQAASATVHALLHHEMALHVSICEAAGISRAALAATEEAPQNLAYTRFVLEAGYSGDFLDLLAALAPCVLGYGEIGARLLGQAADTPYRDWIETYGGDEYQQLCRDTGALIDRAVADRLGPAPETLPRWNQLAGRFATATRLEAAFWELGQP
ncbi:TenA family protein [Paracoccus xiamenensis]|uniref:TenA family protein n=1 Tax=Paracoccus xiamenensis TaxID=2714901 RepID=UPI00140E7D2B|nr:TenA family protein [Paracoccus xiamenensis]NHF73326.1 TenA family protein [Paracoccus xiamenensis]